MMKAFILQLTFLTRIPVPFQVDFKQADYVRGIWFFPLIGLLIGTILSPLMLLKSFIPGTIFGLLIIFGYLMITGGLHLDGLADVCDGLFSGRTKERVFEIMSDSRLGAFGAIGLMLYFLTFYCVGTASMATAISGVTTSWTLPLVVTFPMVGRAIGMMSCGVSKYAKANGLGEALVTYAKTKHVLYALVVSLIMTYLFGMTYCLALVVTIIASGIILYRIHKRLDGITGDVIGCMVEMSQMVYLISALIIGGLK